MEGLDEIRETLQRELAEIPASFFSVWIPIQLSMIALAALLGWAIAAYVRRRLDIMPYIMGWPTVLRRAIRVAIANLGIMICIVVLLLMRIGMQHLTWPSRSYLIGVAVSLATAWVVISIAASLIRNAFFNRVVSVIAWSITALSITGLLDEVILGLDRAGIVIGGLRVTALLALKTAALLLVSLWGAVALSNFIDTRIRTYEDLTPSIQVLLGKLARVALVTFAVLIVLGSVGIDFSALAIFSGAVGVGIGFGLQKIVSNLVSGIILLADKSIKPGDVISVGDQYGFVTTMGARYTAVDTRDGREYLIPNEDFVTQRVVNWSYSSNLIRLEVRFGASYSNDPRTVQSAAVAAALSVPRVLQQPTPLCHLMAFGPSSLEFRLSFWISDPAAGITAVRSNVLLALWDTFDREKIGIPKPGPSRVIYERAKDEPADGDVPPVVR
jgi:small-conductance mechanosensitive channel